MIILIIELFICLTVLHLSYLTKILPHLTYKKEKVVLTKKNKDEHVGGSNLVGFLSIYILFTMHRLGLMKFTH